MESQQRDWNLGKSPTPLCCAQISLHLCSQPVLLLKSSLGLCIYYMMCLLSFHVCFEKKKKQNSCKALELQTKRTNSLSRKLHSCSVTMCCGKEVSLCSWLLTASSTADKSIQHYSFVSGAIKLLFSLGSLLSFYSQYDLEQIIQGPCSTNLLVRFSALHSQKLNSTQLLVHLPCVGWGRAIMV